MTERKIPGEFLEKLIIKGMMIDPQYTIIVSSSFKKKYFDEIVSGEIFYNIWKYYQEYNKIPPREILVQQSKQPDKIQDFFQEIDSVDFDIAENYDYLFNETNSYLKEQAVKDAIMMGVDIVDKGDDPNIIRSYIEEALTKDLKMDLGTNYWDTLKERLTRVLSQTDVRIPTFYPLFDEFISGGFPPYTLNVILARIHYGKSNTIINMAARQVLNGYNAAILTLEMSEDANSQRLDSIYSGCDINRIYIHKDTSKEMFKKLKEVKKNNVIGKLFIKEFPTGLATVNDYRIFLRELGYRGIKIDCLFVDYINLMKPEYKTKGDLYSDGKRISEELRALGLEFKLPIVSCSQLNREGMFTNLKELDFTYIAESVGISSTADSIFILGVNEDDWTYQSEIHFKVVKNRLGGRISEYGKFYLDKKSLKMYDKSEMDNWIEDAKVSGDERIINKIKE